MNISEWLTLNDTAANNWAGTEAVTSNLSLFGQLIVGEMFNEIATESIVVTDTASSLLEMINAVADALDFTNDAQFRKDSFPVITEALAISGAVSILTNLQNTITESLVLTDSNVFGWDKVISESLGLVDTATIARYCIAVITESVEFTATALGQFQFSDTITEAIELAGTVVVNQAIQAAITESLMLNAVVELDGELWETYVLNTNAFHPSVYSGYDFNSYAVYNATAYGCKPDGIYKLTGTTDDGDAFKSGIVLPETQFSSSRDKRFRKAYFGMVSGKTPALRVETDSGDRTYTIESSKANITRDMKGRKWILKVQDFDSLEFLELIPIVLTR